MLIKNLWKNIKNNFYFMVKNNLKESQDDKNNGEICNYE